MECPARPAFPRKARQERTALTGPRTFLGVSLHPLPRPPPSRGRVVTVPSPLVGEGQGGGACPVLAPPASRNLSSPPAQPQRVQYLRPAESLARRSVHPARP